MAHVRSSKNVVSPNAANVPNMVVNNRKAEGENHASKLCNWKNLNDLMQKEPNDLLLSLLCPKLGFLNLLLSTNTNDRMLSLSMEVIARACLSEHARSALLECLRYVNDSCLLKQVFLQYLGNILAECNGESLGEGLTMASLFVFENLLTKLPSKSMPIVTLLLTQIKMITMHCSPSRKIQDTIHQVEDIMRDNQKQIQMGTLMRDQEEVQSTSWDPGEKFRRFSVVPTSKDLHGQRDPHLSKNIIFGKYKNVSNYLDVQFRLLREDLIRPLREGLAELLEWKRRRNFNTRLRTDLKLYTKVHIISPNFASRGLVYKVNFDMSRLKNVVWERTKRLNFGSLVCLSSDEFKNILVATVAERDGIKHGEIQLMFQNEESRQQIDLRPEMSYEMIESPAYFEAYKHVLEGLQFMDEYSLPFVTYLLNHRKSNEPVSPPGYLLRNKKIYDFKCVMKNSCELKSDPLNLDTWPSAEQLGLDLSQYNALRSALTTEFVLIQGPPGTGKTYIGLKIVQILLANERVWNSINFIEARPILIVCFTNHALDQFLELILDGELIEKGSVDLIRIGSQSKSEKLKFYHIREVKRRRRIFHYSDYSDNRHAAFDKMQQLQKEIIPLAAYIELSKENILCESKLQRYMTAIQTNTLLSRRIPHESILFTWLIIDKDQANENLELIENEGIAEIDEIDAELEDVDQDDNEDDKDNINLTNRENFKATKSEMLLAGDFLIEEHGHASDKVKKLKTLYRANRDIMTEIEADNCANVWSLAPADRWRLYNFWVSQHMEPDIQQLKDLLIEHDIQSDIVSEIGKEEDYRCMRSAKIIGMTTTGSARYRDVLQRVQPKIIIVEEAAEVLEAHIVTSLSKGCEHLILIGDHQQLRPNPTVYQLATAYHLNISLFERMVLNELHCERLSIQHRMRPEIVELIVPHIYKTLVNADSVLLYENVWGILGNIFFLNHSIEEQGADDGQSHSNLHEAKFVAALAQYFIGVGYKPSQITVLTTYTGQMFLLRKHMPRYSSEHVRITPVDNYQGEENDIILLSLVRSNKNGNIGFLKIPNRVCVALSRAKKGCFIIGNGDQLANGSRLWQDIIASLKTRNRFVDSLPLACHKHPENIINVSDESDFRLVPWGGCSYSCDYRLDCGHVCDWKCHHFDPKHEEYKCMKKCTRSCSDDHLCKKRCNEECGDCQVLMHEICAAHLHKYSRKCFEAIKNCKILVEKLLIRCGHIEMVSCYLPENEHRCKAPCPKSCPSGHPCKKVCYKDCGNCKVLVEKILPSCQHTCLIPCFMPEHKYKCKEPCKIICPNGHPCSQPCHEPCEACTVLIEKELSRCHHLEMVPCHLSEEQHKCKSPCRKSCPSNHPCMKKCHETCGDCEVLVEKSLLNCKHTALLPCSKSVFTYKCLNPCEKTCSMGHPCVKLCSQVCGLCRIEVDTILPQCKHIKRVSCFNKFSAYEQCILQCEKVLKCGHNCTKLCGEACTILCQVVVPDILLPCLHKATLLCSSDPKTHKCTKNVQVTLCIKDHTKMAPCHRSSSYKIGAYECDTMVESTCSSVMKHKSKITCDEHSHSIFDCRMICDFEQSCGHRCQQKCNWCTSMKKHQNCTRCCTRKLPLCSHKCLAECSETCPPCGLDCAQSCRHGKCRHRCSEPCIPCREPCDWTCPHHTCRLACSEPCTRPACDEPCRRKLSCKHQCRGLCGEPCPDKCFTCNPKQVKTIERELVNVTITKSTRFVQLRPCGDILPVEYIDSWVKQSTTNQASAGKSFKGFLSIICPLETCKREVEYCPRYNALIKRVARSQEIAKSQIIQSKTFSRKFEKAKDKWKEWKNFSKADFTAQLYSRLDIYTVCLWNECLLHIAELSDTEKISYPKIYENFEQEQEFLVNVQLGDILKTCKNLIGLSRLYLLFNVIRLSVVTRGPKLGVLDKCLKRLSSTNVDTDAKQTWRCVITVNDALKENFKLKPTEEIIDLKQLFKAEINISSQHSAWNSCTRGHVYVYNEDRQDTETDMDLHCPTCHSIDRILSETLQWPENNTLTVEQRIEEEPSIETIDLPTTAATDAKLENKAQVDTNDENKGARPKTVSSAKQWALENTQAEVTWSARGGQRGSANGRRPFQRGNFDERGQHNTSSHDQDDGWRQHNELQADRPVDWRKDKQKSIDSNNDRWAAPTVRGRSNRQQGFKPGKFLEKETNRHWRNDNIRTDADFKREVPGRAFERTNDNRPGNRRVNESSVGSRWNTRGNYPFRRSGTNLASRLEDVLNEVIEENRFL